MGPAWILILIFGLLGIFILGLIILVAVPAFRLTISNLFVFVIGAILGIFTVPNLIIRYLIGIDIYGHMTIGGDDFALVLFFFGALGGGTILVWLKMRLQKVVIGHVEKHVAARQRSAASGRGAHRRD
jgi:hypothetical protein